ncbi:E2F-associated phosphoprotein [Elysia marginata]|uniref:E2F-associated phosphoprotein n=1 Tax=Elysia marginata TaxID=1093978 RepID=A0AAV4GC97_9GAST|nr:E2F-associated phosphoprotein [Elysia marginata]
MSITEIVTLIIQSSEDEINIILHGTPEQRRKLQHLHRKRLSETKSNEDLAMNSSSSEDEFEKEMETELNLQVELLEKSRGNCAIEGSITSNVQQSSMGHNTLASDVTSKDTKSTDAEQFYDDVYFDSDEEEDSSNQQNMKKKSKHRIISNDELLYDPYMDDKDQKWVDKQRQRNGNKSGGKQGKKANSDALLDCPACLTTLCIDCQRHEIHKNQYRAMFVMNCQVDTSETLECPEQHNKKKRGKKKPRQEADDTTSSSTNKDLFHPVRCLECGTVVGVYDSDEVYHFFNVLASHT